MMVAGGYPGDYQKGKTNISHIASYNLGTKFNVLVSFFKSSTISSGGSLDLELRIHEVNKQEALAITIDDLNTTNSTTNNFDTCFIIRKSKQKKKWPLEREIDRYSRVFPFYTKTAFYGM